MNEMKDKMKGFMKRVNNQLSSSSSSSSSGKFKGQGRVLGSAPSEPVNSAQPRLVQTPNPRPTPPPPSSSTPKPSPQHPPTSDQSEPPQVRNPELTRKPPNGFNPYDSLITSSKVSKNGFSLDVFECPICGASYRSEDEVSEHVDTCLNSGSTKDDGFEGVSTSSEKDNILVSKSELEVCVGSYLSQKRPVGSLDVVLRLLRNIVKEPENAKFRKLRMNNSKIREAIGDVAGGVEFLDSVGFELKEEEGEMWAVMEVPRKEQISLIGKAIQLLERRDSEVPLMGETQVLAAPIEKEVAVEPVKVDRQIRVFFAVPENVAAKIVLPDSFYNLSLDEIKREADMRKKKIAESQLLIPKAYKEKQAKAARKRYRRAVIRVQFPDGVVLQGVFSPQEPTTALYEFVSSALKEPCLEFELLDPVMVRRRVIPRPGAAGERATTLAEEDLVPSALVKFKPMETDSIVFTGLSNELLQIIEPLVTDSAVTPL